LAGFVILTKDDIISLMNLFATLFFFLHSLGIFLRLPQVFDAMNENPLRVLVICSHPVQYMSPLLRRMSHRPEIKLQVAYCSLRGANASYDPEFNTTVQWDVPLLDGYDWVEVPNRGSGGEGFWSLSNPGLWKVIRRGSFDAVVCFTGYIRASFWIAYFAARLSGSAFIFGTDASSLTPRDSRSWKVAFKKRFWPRLFRLADQIVVGSSAGVELMRSLGLPESRITLTPFVVDNDWWSTRAAQVDRSEVRKMWGITSQELVVLFCAKLQSWKRPADLLRAFAAAAIPDTVLVFAGEGPLRAQLTTEAEKLGVTSRVRILGFTNQSQLPTVYTGADLFVLPSDYDPCPVVVCEAMLCGLPVLLSDEIRGRFDLVRSGLTGDIFPCGDVPALTAALRRLLTDRGKLAELSINARKRMETWTPRDNVLATIDAITRAVQHRRGADPPYFSNVSGRAISSGG
jgi:glycosyltransferase involved in cell wall biosynthesis